MGNQKTFSDAVGIIGNISSMALFLSPVPTFIKIFKTKAVGSFTPAPYVLTVLNCMFWIIYGLKQVKDLTLVLSINSAGLVIEFIYVTIYLIYARGNTKRNCVMLVGLCAVIFAVVTGVTLGHIKHSMRGKVIGSVCVIIGIIQNFAPLAVIRTVIRTKSAEYLPWLLSTWILVNGGIWTAYGCWPVDIFLIIPNAFGVAFGIAQLTLYFIYRKNPKVATDKIYVKTTTPDEKFALQEHDDPEADYFPELSPPLETEPTYTFPPDLYYRLEEILEEIKRKEDERIHMEKERQKSEDERVLQETQRNLAERNRERHEREREEADKKRRRDSRAF